MATFSYAQRFDGLSGNAIREIFKLLASPNIISFAGGNPSPSSFEPEVIAGLTAEVMQKNGPQILQYGATEGYAPLRESAAAFLKGSGVIADPADILPVSGSLQAMDLLCKALINPGDTILVENPTFLGCLHTMKLYQAHIMPIPTDHDGAIPASLEENIEKYHPKFVYLIPTFQNPSGNTLSLARRKEIADIAARTQTLIVEDDPYRDLRYEGEALPAIYSYAHDGYVMYLGSFSKLISPGLRVGLAVGDAGLIRKMTVGKQGADVHTCNLTQAIVDAYLRRGLLPAHLQSVCASYRLQRDAMIDGFEAFPKGVTHTNPEGGLFVWVTLPEHMDTVLLMDKAVARNVAYVPGTHFFCDGTGKNTMRLNFSMSTPEKIQEGMKILAQLLHDEC